jgi:hypothetical protein
MAPRIVLAALLVAFAVAVVAATVTTARSVSQTRGYSADGQSQPPTGTNKPSQPS